MNAITLLSGWANSGSSSDEPSASASAAGRSRSHSRAAAVAGEGRGGSSGSRTRANTVSSSSSSIDAELAAAYAAGSRPDPTHHANVTSLRDEAGLNMAASEALKPLEAQLYEELEAQQTLANAGPAASLFAETSPDPSTSYPTPPPTPPIPLDVAHTARDSELLLGSAMIWSTSKLAEKQASTASLHQQRDRHARQLARFYPVRCLMRLYVLLRRFLALFGIRLDPHHTESSASHSPISASPIPPYSPRQTAYLASPVSVAASTSASSLHAPPPSYADATRTALKQTPPKRSRWRLSGFRTRSTPFGALSASEEDGGSSSDSSTLTSHLGRPPPSVDTNLRKKRPRIDSVGQPPSPSVPGASPSLPSRPSRSVAQVALSKPKLLVLDLDETLIHSTSRMGLVGGFNPITSADGSSRWNANTSGLKVKVVEVVLEGRSVIYHVYKRPWVDFFLKKAGFHSDTRGT